MRSFAIHESTELECFYRSSRSIFFSILFLFNALTKQSQTKCIKLLVAASCNRDENNRWPLEVQLYFISIFLAREARFINLSRVDRFKAVESLAFTYLFE